jgi:hypothetical protein
MAQGYILYLIPKDAATYRPTPAQITRLMKYFAARLEIPGEYAVNGEEELSLESAVEHLRAGVQSSHGGTECVVSFNDLVSGSLFGYDPEMEDPDVNYWADELRVCVTATPFPYCDWDYEEAACAGCGQRISQPFDVLEEVRLSGAPVACPCGAKTLPEDLKKTAGVQLVQFAIWFTGNRGWKYEVAQDRDAFADQDFLAEIEKILGVPVDVVASQH